MEKAKVFVDGILAGHLIEWEKNQRYEFSYLEDYSHQSISLTMPVTKKSYHFDQFPPFFDGFLRRVSCAMLRKTKIDSNDRFEQLIRVGGELVGQYHRRRGSYMRRCPITYEVCENHYSSSGLKSLSTKLNHLNDFPFGKEKQLELAIQYADKLSFSGVQPKLNAKLNIDAAIFEIVGKGNVHAQIASCGT